MALLASGFFVKVNGDKLSGIQDVSKWASAMTTNDLSSFHKDSKIPGINEMTRIIPEDPRNWLFLCDGDDEDADKFLDRKGLCKVVTVETSFLAKSDGFIAEYETHVRNNRQGMCISEVSMLSLQVCFRELVHFVCLFSCSL